MTKHTELWIDALDFEQKGGWKEDTQYVHLMGSGYLIAADEPGVPVEDAVVTVNVPAAGRYRVWVRDRNWYRQYSPGKFKVLVDGEETGNTLGALPSDKWLWEVAGDVELEAGEHTVTLRDLTGYFARCAAIILTTDMDYLPSREIDRIYADRARMKGMEPGVKEGGRYDVIVVGGGPGGVPAAIAAARLGAKVLLLQNRPMLGGNASDEVGITMDGAMVEHVYAREGGIAEEIRRLRDRDPTFIGDWTRAMEKLAAAEENLTVLCNMHVDGVEMESPSVIRSVRALNIRDLSRKKFDARIFIDCTGDAWLGYYAGAKIRFGREAAWQYGESLAPEVPDLITMSGCLKSGNRPFFFKTDEPVEYHAPEWVPQLPKDDREFGRVIRGNGASMMWWLEAPNNYDDLWDGEETRDALLMVVLGYYDHIKNYWSGKEKAANFRFRFTSVFNGKRESRRLVGDYVLTQDDCVDLKRFEDAISYTGWHMDVHHPEGIYSGAKGPMYCVKRMDMPLVPYRSLYSANIDNLMMAGRNISTTHVALGTVRVENTIAAIGQATGTAAGMCIKMNESPRGIYQRHIGELQQLLLKNDQFIPGLKNEDAGDPCLSAKATASSVKADEMFQSMQGNDDELKPLTSPRMMEFTVACSEGDVENVWVKLGSTNADPTPVTMYARVLGGSSESFEDDVVPVSARGVVPPMGEHWVKIPIHIPVEEDNLLDRRYIRVWLDAAEGISWRGVKDLPFFSRSGVMNEKGKWNGVANYSYRYSLKEPVERLADCSPENVINGYSRIIDAEHYQWVSDPGQELPQWIELEFEKPAEINSVSIVFDTDMTNPGTCWHPASKAEGVPLCVKDYEVEVYADGAWRRVAEEEGNFMRKRTHGFETVRAEKIRVTVKATWGDRSARIQEIRASLEK